MRRRRTSAVSAILGAAIIAGACSADSPDETAQDIIEQVDLNNLPQGQDLDFGPRPTVPDGSLTPAVAEAVDTLFSGPFNVLATEQIEALAVLGASEDPRIGWILSDLMRVSSGGGTNSQVAEAASNLVGKPIEPFAGWNDLTSTLIAWDIPAPPDYLSVKRTIYTTVEPRWVQLFSDNSVVDWRHVSWGGVFIDDRPYDTTDDPCNCIPAADNPEVQSAEDATWLDDEDTVFGVVINGEARAYPRQIMEVREMINDSLGGRDFAIPYCTLCGSAQVWFTDDLPEDIERPIFRTSGLLIRSNKVMYDLTSGSIFDTFRGGAESGPLLDRGIELNGHTVVTTSWGAWVEDNPDTTVLVEDLALGRDFDFRNGRDANGPIFPIGDVDPRLPVQEDVLGILLEDDTPLAIHVRAAAATLAAGDTIELDNGWEVISAGDGIRVVDGDGEDVVGHQAFWFAWSQFHEDTEVWPSSVG